MMARIEPTIYEPAVVILKPEMIEWGEGCRVDSMVKIEGGEGITFGRWCHIASFAHLNIGGGRLHLGDGVAISSGARVVTGSNTQDGLFMSAAAPREEQVITKSVVRLEIGAFIGVNATILPGVTVGEYAIVGAGAVVTKDVPAHQIWAGVPAHKIGERHMMMVYG